MGKLISLLKASIAIVCMLMFMSVTVMAQNITAIPNHANGSVIPERGVIEITYDRTVTFSFCAGAVLINGFDMTAFVELNDLRTVLSIPYDATDWNGADSLFIEISNDAIYESANINNRAPLSLVFVRYGATSVVRDLDMPENILIHPNPVSDVLHIEAENLKQIEIIDMLGRVVIRRTPQRSDVNQIDVSGLRGGVYFIRLTTTNNRVTVERFVKK